MLLLFIDLTELLFLTVEYCAGSAGNIIYEASVTEEKAEDFIKFSKCTARDRNRGIVTIVFILFRCMD